MFRRILIISLGILALAGCDKDPVKPDPETMFKVTIENISTAKMFSATGVFNTPVGKSDPAPIGPGDAYEFSFSAAPGSKLSFATMLVQTNDIFYAPNGMGIRLFDSGGSPVTGDVTSQIMLWDAGTEVNEEPGFGLNQAPRQSGPNTGVDENGVVRLVNDGFTYPDVSQVIRVTIETQ